MRLFYPIPTIDWTRVFFVVTALTGSWKVLSEILPAEWQHIGEVVLAAVATLAAALTRSNKWAPRERTLTEKEQEKE